MSPEINRLLAIYENRMALLWQLDGQMHECDYDDRFYRLEKRFHALEKEVSEARANLVAAIENLSTNKE